MPQDHQVELFVREGAVFEVFGEDRQVQLVAGVGGGSLAQFGAYGVPASVAQLAEQYAAPAADVEHLAGPLVTLYLAHTVVVQVIQQPFYDGVEALATAVIG